MYIHVHPKYEDLLATVTGIFVLKEMVQGPIFSVKKLVPQNNFAGKNGPTLKAVLICFQNLVGEITQGCI